MAKNKENLEIKITCGNRNYLIRDLEYRRLDDIVDNFVKIVLDCQAFYNPIIERQIVKKNRINKQK